MVRTCEREFGALDMETVIRLEPDAVLVPKVDGPEDVAAVGDLLDEAGVTVTRVVRFEVGQQ